MLAMRSMRVKAAAILGQVSTFLTNRESTLAALKWPDYHAQRLQIIKTVIRAHTRAILAAPASAQKRPRLKSAGESA